jgi:transposase
MAGAILYGLMRRIRSSRQLEYACGNHVDFLWLVEGRSTTTPLQVPHAFQEPLKSFSDKSAAWRCNWGLSNSWK